MNSIQPSRWTAVARSRDLQKKPVAVSLDGVPLVIFRANGEVSCLTDRCPHRSAPLSGGEVVNGALECPYHGWRYDGAGRCVAMPGHLGEMPRSFVPRHAVREADGLVFVSLAKEPGTPYTGSLSGPDSVSMMLANEVHSTLAEVAENILDATHTHYTHRGVLRGLSARRYKVTVTITGGDGWVEARYEGEPQQEGLVSRLLEGERSISIGRFIAPGIAELEFWGKRGPNLVTTFHLRQDTPDEVRGIGVLTGPKQVGLGLLKGWLFMPFFRVAIGQDQRILSAAHRRRKQFGDIKQMIGPLDVMRPHIDAILEGRRPTVADQPATVVMEL